MKKSINILMAGAFVAATMGLTSCDDFLKENPLDAKASTEFWKTADDASRVLQHSITVVCPT